MAQKSVTEMVQTAKKDIENLSPQQAQAEIDKGNITLIDIREPDEVKQNGKITGSVNLPRGMLAFYTDSSLPSYKKEFNKEKRIILYCASSGRSALAVKTLKEMGYTHIAHINGGFKAWKEAGLPVMQGAK
ncbi:MAG: rhodanese-like domain-containing protein [Bacteroidetes bacterium]|nr:rhodanese-like domain-containing protein [Bacteroidota bacterium]